MDENGRPRTWKPGVRMRGRGLRSLILLLAVASAGQFVIVAIDYAVPWMVRIWQLREEDAWGRTAYLASWIPDPDAQYLSFLRREIPPEAVVFVPPGRGEYRSFKWLNNVTYNLFPRRVVRCTPLELECLSAYRGKPLFVLAMNEFPSEDFLEGLAYDRIQHAPDRGVIWIQGLSEGGG